MIGKIMSKLYNDYEIAAKNIIEQVGKTIVIAIPLAIGKPIGFINALYQLACDDNSIQLTIITGLTLSRPTFSHDLEKRLAEPILKRILKNYEDPLYEKAREQQNLPSNISIIEFYLSPGKYLNNSMVQQDYISSNYTLVKRDLLNYSVNVIAQQMAKSSTQPDLYSLSSNTDLFKDIAHDLRTQYPERKIAIIAEVNNNLPFMVGDAEINSQTFTHIIDTHSYPALFALPHHDISAEDHAIGLYTSTLIKDGSCLQIGIGSISNAIANALVMREKENTTYSELMSSLLVQEKFGETVATLGSLKPFDEGLCASTEMLSDAYLHLYKEGILRKRVYDHAGIQRLLNAKKITESISPTLLDILIEENIIHSQLTFSDVMMLKKYGIFKSDISFQSNNLLTSTGVSIPANLNSSEAKHQIILHCLGEKLISGKIIYAAFFLGTVDLYQQLHDLTPTELNEINMTTIQRTNTLCWSHELSILQRQHARFVNSTMMATMGGFVVSDGLKDLQEVSGVGGQFDFIEMAQKLKNARSIINCRSTRVTLEGVQSNIVLEYPYSTSPRHLRDIIVTEYGIADCRSKTDSEIIKVLLNITDSRFQNTLLNKIKKLGKISPDYQIPDIFQKNYPDILQSKIQEFQKKGYLKRYPLGCDLTDIELTLQSALLYIKQCSGIKLLKLVILSFLYFKNVKSYHLYLSRMNLETPDNLKEWFYKKLITYTIYLQTR